MRVVNAEQMRMIESKAIEDYGIPSLLLMENAAYAVVQEIKEHLAQSNPNLSGRKIVVFAGKGNNGGDGLAVARHLVLMGLDVTVFLFAEPGKFTGDAALNLRLFQGTEGKMIVVDGDKQKRLARLALAQSEVVVDDIYGTGLRGPMPDVVEEYVQEVNRSSAWVISVDIPSGVETNTGNVHGRAIRADTTVTFGLPKLGHFLGEGPEYCGRLIVDSISIPSRILEDERVLTFVLTDAQVRKAIPRRKLKGHKGSHGRGILVAGSGGMSGAAALAARAALRSGIGLLQMIVPEGIARGLDQSVIEATVWPAPGEYLDVGAWEVIEKRCQGAQALAIGPGLGKNEEFLPVLEEVLRSIPVPVILDADALNLLATDMGLIGLRKGKGPLILTPHPGEMARLCGCTIREVENNRLELALAKAAEWEAVLVLKGAVTIIACPDGRAFLNPTGNPGLGTGGTGDVLTGCILGWLAQGVPPVEAAQLSVYLHGKAADALAAEVGWAGFLASEVADMIPKVRRTLELNQ